MWAVIFRRPEIQRHPKLRKRMLDELDYESVYGQVLESEEHDQVEKRAFVAALRSGYQQLHEIVCRQDTDHIASSSNACQQLLTRFAGQDQQERGFIFTLNQDLFVERYYSCGDPHLTIPGLSARNWFNGRIRSELTPGSRVKLPDDASVEVLSQKFWSKSTDRLVYVKLHGSYGWQTSD